MYLHGVINPRSGLPFPDQWRKRMTQPIWRRGLGDITVGPVDTSLIPTVSDFVDAAAPSTYQITAPQITQPFDITPDISSIQNQLLDTSIQAPAYQITSTPIPAPAMAYNPPAGPSTVSPAQTSSNAPQSSGAASSWVQYLAPITQAVGNTAVALVQASRGISPVLTSPFGLPAGVTPLSQPIVPSAVLPGGITAQQYASMSAAQQAQYRASYPQVRFSGNTPVSFTSPSGALTPVLNPSAPSLLGGMSTTTMLLLGGGSLLVMVLLMKRK